MSDSPGGVCHGTDATDIRYIMRWNDNATAEQRGLLSAVVDVLNGDIGMPVSSFARRIRSGVHHSCNILAVFLEQCVYAERSSIDFLAFPTEEPAKECAAARLIGGD